MKGTLKFIPYLADKSDAREKRQKIPAVSAIFSATSTHQSLMKQGPHEASLLLGQHGTNADELAILGFNHDTGLTLAITITISPLFVVNSHIGNLRPGKTPTVTHRPNPGKNSSIAPSKQNLRSATYTQEKYTDHQQTNSDKGG